MISPEERVDVAAICEAFDLGIPTAPRAYVARGELGRVSRLATTAGVWAIKEIDLFVPTVEEADANVDLQELMLDAGAVKLPRPRRTTEGHGLLGNVRVYEWLEMSPVPVNDIATDELLAAALARMHVHAPPTDRSPDPWYSEAMNRHGWDRRSDEGAGTWWAQTVEMLVVELVDLPHPLHRPAHICHLDVCPENVFSCDGRLVVIDWENAGPAATAQDLGSTLWDFCQGDVRRTRTLVDTYMRRGGPLDRLEPSVFDTARVVQSNLIDFHTRRALDLTGTPESHERAERALRTLLARPLTRRLIDAMTNGSSSDDP